jgi:hypothetical protein
MEIMIDQSIWEQLTEDEIDLLSSDRALPLNLVEKIQRIIDERSVVSKLGRIVEDLTLN